MSRKTEPAGAGKKHLSSEDQEVWESVTLSVDPLSAEERVFDPTGGPEGAATRKHDPVAGKKIVAQDNLRPKQQSRPASPPPSPLPQPAPGRIDRRAQRKIARGQSPIDSTLDLHGMTQEQAYARLSRHIEDASHAGERCILVITGKGGGAGKANRGEGVLRRNLPDWLATQALSDKVLAISSAGRSHGGDGAFYVRLKKRRNQGV